MSEIKRVSMTLETPLDSELNEGKLIYEMMSYVVYLKEAFGFEPYATPDDNRIEIDSHDNEYGLVFEYHFNELRIGFNVFTDDSPTSLQLVFNNCTMGIITDVVKWTEEWKWG